MERIFEDLVHFANTNTLNEPLFDSPMGRLNIKQAGIAGVGCLAIAMYALDTMNLLVIPLMIIPLILGLSSRGNQTMDMYIMSWFMFKIRGSSTSLIKNKKLAKKKAATESTSRAMKIKSKSKTIKKIESKSIDRQIMINRLYETKHIKFNCSTIDGTPLKNHPINVFLDNELVFNYTTNSLGQMTAAFAVNTLGKKKLKIMAKDIDSPLIEGMIEFVLKENRL